MPCSVIEHEELEPWVISEVVASRPAVVEARIAIDVAAALERIAVAAFAVAKPGVAATAAGPAVTVPEVAVGSAAPGMQVGMEHRAGQYLPAAADMEGSLDLDSLDNKNWWGLLAERQVTGWWSIVAGFALAVAGAELGKDCSGSLDVAGIPHHSVDLGSAGNLGSLGCAVDRRFVVGLG